jgi:sugar phosphate isomerase/epimerase
MDDVKFFAEKTSRRTFLKQSAAALAAATLLPTTSAFSKDKVKIKTNPALDSNFGGVQIGSSTYSWISQPAPSVHELINTCHKAGVSSLEIMYGEFAKYAGQPENVPAEQIVAWRKNMDLEKIKEIRNVLAAAGIGIHVLNCSPASWSDEEIDRVFLGVKALGAKATVQELSLDSAKRLAPFAEKHGVYVAMHNHFQYAQAGFSCDPILDASPMMMLNFDCGHYLGSTGKDPRDFIEKYHDRIFSIHLKDKTGPNADPANFNQVWGQGETPLREILRMVRDNKWPIHCDIELEYPIKPWSDPLKEVYNCVCFAREALTRK